ncbi:stalk domain-containing protein [Cohnella sp.]|uniref:stalk domain-containing protein n=1 Tax=Cohnella sp. TaxID=1883426 RepID=UPI003703C67D
MLKRWIIVTCVMLMLIPAWTDAPGVQAASKLLLYDGSSNSEQQKALASVNELRRQMGLNEVKLDSALTKAAINHARYANAYYTLKSTGNLSAEEKGRKFYTQPTAEERAAAAGYSGAGDILETVYMKERAYDEFDMASEIYELSLDHERREVMLTPRVSAIGIARVGKATVIVGAANVEDVMTAPVTVSVYPYDGMKKTWAGYFGMGDPQNLYQGMGTTLTIFSSRRDVSDIKASLSTLAGNRHIRIPLIVEKLGSGYGYVLTAQRQLRGDREYTAEVSFQSGGQSMVKKWSFRTSNFQYQLNFDDMPLMHAPPLYIANGSSEVPMRYLFELFGARVEWNKSTRTITAVKNELSLKMTIDSHTAYLNGQAVPLDSPPHLYVYTTYVPLRFISEAFGYEVEYHPADQSIDIWTELVDNPKVDSE